MPSARRLRLLGTVAVAVLLTLVFMSRLRQAGDSDSSSLQGFYHKTKSAIDRAQAGRQAASKPGGGTETKGHHLHPDKDADGDVDEDDTKLTKEVTDRLKAAEQQAKELANSKAPNKPDVPSNVVGIGSSAGGQGKKKKIKDSRPEVEDETGEDHKIADELDAILRKSPVIIFSKSYCPYSKRAKGLLLEKYAIDPAPYVVELDEHPLGPQMQARLGTLTGRKTVPNIMVNGKSIGGSDDIAELDRDKSLVTKIKSLGGKRVTMKERFSGDKASP
ncbi:glutaredoxin-C4 [Magnaporthiopsis poae ATCC 64411]|uniref:Glutaredoxin-C4 n=1 Tax=Magnaporthiopsis poae (strain ATCC 64411 / 73-15) TaxID=644358 RepID=A0A0C4EGE0_MAGP6|nr:glutaredoxin-C4 [Magnaporthiopsis poae ATCC 64411]